MKICNNCNTEYEDGRFCPKCGGLLVDSERDSEEKKQLKNTRRLFFIVLALLVISIIVIVALLISRNMSSMDSGETAIDSNHESGLSEEAYTDINEETAISELMTDKEYDIFSTSEIDQDEYILPNSNSMYLSDSDIEGMSLRELNYAKNEIFARHGRGFKSRELREYFSRKSWYKEEYSPDEFDKYHSSSALNKYEKANAQFLSDAEYSKNPNGYELDK